MSRCCHKQCWVSHFTALINFWWLKSHWLKRLKFFPGFSSQRILRDRSFPRTSDLDWGKEITSDFTDSNCVSYHHVILFVVTWVWCSCSCVQHFQYDNNILMCWLFPPFLHFRPDSQSSFEGVLLGNSSSLEPHEETKVWQVRSPATNSCLAQYKLCCTSLVCGVCVVSSACLFAL